MTELKPCPFCGGEAEISELTYPMKHYTVICSNEKCYAEMGDFISNEDAIRMWNTRPNPWHTGKPSEEGDYIVALDLCGLAYKVMYWNGVVFEYFNDGYTNYQVKDILAYQKIEPYKENEDGRTD